MRDFKGMKRQRGRNRSGGGGGGGGGGGKSPHNVNRAFDSNGPDNVKIRGHAQHVYEKYQQLARDASSGGDRVLAENYLQHAEHYYRVLRTLQPQRPASDFVNRDSFSGTDLDFEDEGDGGATEESEGASAAGEGTEGASEPRREERQDRGERRDRPERGEWRRDEREARPEGRERPDRGEEPRCDDQREGRRDRFESRRDRPEARRDERADTPREARPAEPEAAPAADESASRSPLLRSEDGGVSQAPAFLQAPTGGEEAEGARRPRARRRPRAVAAGEGAPPPETSEDS